MAAAPAIAAIVTAVAAVGSATASYIQSQHAADAQANLAKQQQDQLAAEQRAASAEAAQQAATGAHFGFEDNPTHAAFTGFGMSSGGVGPSANSGRGQITGMSAL